MRISSINASNKIQQIYLIQDGNINDVIKLAKEFNFYDKQTPSKELIKEKIKERFAKENISLDILKE
jgi:hypothetical protein